MRPSRLLAAGIRRAMVGIWAGIASTAAPAVAAQPWLFVNDVHFDPTDRSPDIKWYGDPGLALLNATLAEMKRLTPDPPVIVMAGDFLSHSFKRETAIPTLVDLAQRFNRAFPRTQFVIALGNEDSACGDYAIAADSAFLRAVADAWAPLVNRNGAAPGFRRTFAHDGFYTAKLPVGGVTAVVVDNAFWSTFYTNACGTKGDPTAATLRELDHALAPAGHERRWLVMHIPPGVDVASTLQRAHRLAIVPFLRPVPRDRVLALIGDPARRVELVVTGHVHRFDFRAIPRADGTVVPLLIAPAISPLLYNAPSFLTAQVGEDGVVRSLEEHAYVDGGWHDAGGFADLALSELSGAAIVDLHRRLAQDRDVRARFERLYTGDARFTEITERNWKSYWCAQTELRATPYRQCLDQGGLSFLTPRGVFVVGAALGGVLLLAAAFVALVVALLRRASKRRGA